MSADDGKPKNESRANAKLQEELIELEMNWGQTIVTNDAAAIGKFMTDDWCLINPDGSIMERSQFLGAIVSGDVTHDLMEADDWRVRVHGNTAVVTAQARSRGKYKGRAFSTHERSTSVYTKIDGRWQCVLTQLTAMKKK